MGKLKNVLQQEVLYNAYELKFLVKKPMVTWATGTKMDLYYVMLTHCPEQNVHYFIYFLFKYISLIESHFIFIEMFLSHRCSW